MALPYVTASQAERIAKEIAKNNSGEDTGLSLYKHFLEISGTNFSGEEVTAYLEVLSTSKNEITTLHSVIEDITTLKAKLMIKISESEYTPVTGETLIDINKITSLVVYTDDETGTLVLELDTEQTVLIADPESCILSDTVTKL